MKNTLLTLANVSKKFRYRGGTLHAVHNLSLSLREGEIFGIGGESGCGKSTVAKMMMEFAPPSSGSILFSPSHLNQDPKKRRLQIQMIFQQPAASLNPSMKVKTALEEPLKVHGLVHKTEIKKRAILLLSQVGLSEDFLERFPHELSGGEKQRVAIARAMTVDPRVLICDEPFSALDGNVRTQIIALLRTLQKEHNLSCVVISHDLTVLSGFTDRMAILYAGQLMELGPSNQIYTAPLHPYTQALISAVLSDDPAIEKKRSRIILKGEVPSLVEVPAGCPFYSRCPHAKPLCKEIAPLQQEVHPGHFVACHLYKK